MKDMYANFKNKYTINTILNNEVLASSFFKAFLNLEFVEWSINEFSDAIFITKGVFSNDLEVIGTDDLGIKHLIHIRFLEMHHGLTSAYIDASDGRWLDLKRRTQNSGFIHSHCQNVRVLCFFYFNFSKDIYHSTRQYNFNELPTLLQFDCYELLKFDKNVNSCFNERDIWLFAIKNGGKSVQDLENTPFVRLLKNALKRENWGKEDNKTYDREYIVKTRDEYKTAMALRSLEMFLKTEDVMRIQVERIYQEVTKDKVNLSNPNLAITNINLLSKKGEIIQTNESLNVIQTALNNLINKHIQDISDIKIENFDLNIREILDENKVKNFIDENWNLF